MKSFKKILCPYDFSEFADEAVLYAIKLSDNDTLITLLNVIQLPYVIDPNGFTYFELDMDEFRKTSEKAMEKKLAELKEKSRDLNIDYVLEIANDPAEIILKTQKEGDYELIVMGSHGRKGFGRLLMGSVAESVVRETKCPVLIIKN